MKKLVCYFVLLSSLFCGVSGASSNKESSNINNKDRKWAVEVGPYQAISIMFKNDLKDRDFREDGRIVAVPGMILEMYPNRLDLQKQAVNAFGWCMRNQTINGRRKYTEHDVNVLMNFSKKKLGLN